MVAEADVRAAVKARATYIMDNLDTMTLKVCRQTLEQDMGLAAGALKPHKDLLSALIDQLIAKKAAAAPQPAAADPEAEEEQSEEEADSDSEGEARGKKQRKKGGDPPSKRQKREEQAAKPSGPRVYGRKVEKLRGVCKAATITIPPNLYSKHKGDEGALEGALQALLAKHGLSADSGRDEIAAAKQKLVLARDLDGIDTSNIIQDGGRRPRRGAAPASFKPAVAHGLSEEEESSSEGESEEESEAGADSDEDVVLSGSDAEGSKGGRPAKAKKAAPAKQRQQPKKAAKKATISESESEAASSEEEEPEADSGSEEEAAAPKAAKKAAAAAKSPDENTAARGNGSGSARKGGKPARPADSLEDSDDEPVAAAGKGRALADWSDDE